jgi:LuxR family maltose regulon positive regulatory protein
LLALLLPSLEQLGYSSKIIEIHLLKAVGLVAKREMVPAMRSLKTAVNLARPEGFTRIFIEEGVEIGGLLQELADQSEFTTKLLTALPSAETPSTQADLVEPLSDREIEVLRMLATELSAPEIAEHLYIAVSTMRTHTKNIYGKLDVHSRFEAISRARELNLL